jgi:outer membrane immunogenic protein
MGNIVTLGCRLGRYGGIDDNNTTSISGNAFTVGYTVGGGVEYAFSDTLSGLLEYRYTDVGNTDHTGNIFDGDFTYDHENAFHSV